MYKKLRLEMKHGSDRCGRTIGLEGRTEALLGSERHTHPANYDPF